MGSTGSGASETCMMASANIGRSSQDRKRWTTVGLNLCVWERWKLKPLQCLNLLGHKGHLWKRRVEWNRRTWYWRSQLRVVEKAQCGQWRDGRSGGIHQWGKVDTFDVALVWLLWILEGGVRDNLLTIGEHAIVRRVPTCCRFLGIPSILEDIEVFCFAQSVYASLLSPLRIHFCL